MNLTVEEALSIYPLSKAKLVAGAGGTSRVIKSVNTMDAPDVFDWISNGEMLFTTAFAIKDTPSDFLRLLKRLNERGSAGIGIKLGRYWSEIPEIVLEEADKLNFPILELPYEFAFSDQMRALFHAEFERNTKKLYDALEKQKQLVRFAMQTDNYTNSFQTINDILDHPIVVISARGQFLFNSSDWPEAELLKEWPWPAKFHPARTDSGWVCRLPLLKDDDCYGYLLVITKDGSIHKDEKGLFHQAAEILSHHLDHVLDDQQSVASYQWSASIERYLQRHITRETFLEQARALGSPLLSSPQVGVLIVPVAGETAKLSVPKALRDIRREISYHPALGLVESHHVAMGETLFYLFKLKDGVAGTEAYNQLIKSLNEISTSMRNLSARCYVSKVKPELGEAAEAYEECAEARRISQSLSFDASVVLFSELEFSYLFSHIPNEIMEKYCNDLLLPLKQKDVDYYADMLKTLEVYFSTEGQINEVAKQLFIHRNTVQYRLEKISELLGLDFRKMGDLMKVKMMFMFRHLLAMDQKKQTGALKGTSA